MVPTTRARGGIIPPDKRREDERNDWAEQELAPKAWRAFYPKSGKWRIMTSRPKRTKFMSSIRPCLDADGWRAYNRRWKVVPGGYWKRRRRGV